ncbi:MAG: hypothetical protein M3280_12550 [Actinomycetota bacterium]|nr:hypothetical protein [Actinomycetota bacterium]
MSGPELVERIKEWGRVASRATSRHVGKGRIVSTFPRDRELVQQLRRLIAAEARCCSFMQFNVEERPEQVVVELRVPDDMSETLAGILGLLTQQAPSASQPASN